MVDACVEFERENLSHRVGQRVVRVGEAVDGNAVVQREAGERFRDACEMFLRAALVDGLQRVAHKVAHANHVGRREEVSEFDGSHVRVFHELEAVFFDGSHRDDDVHASEGIGNHEVRGLAAFTDKLVFVGHAHERLAAPAGNLFRLHAGTLVVGFLLEFQVEYRGAFGHLPEDNGHVVFGIARKDLGAVPLVFVARGAGEDAQHLALDVVPERQERFQQFHGAQGVAHVLYRLQAFDIVEEPATARETEQAELLDFEEAYGLRAHRLVLRFQDCLFEEFLDAGLVLGGDEGLHVVVAGFPRADF